MGILLRLRPRLSGRGLWCTWCGFLLVQVLGLCGKFSVFFDWIETQRAIPKLPRKVIEIVLR